MDPIALQEPAYQLAQAVVLVGGGVVLPTSAYGDFAGVARWLPSGALGDGLRAAFTEGVVSLPALGVLAVWAVVAGTLTGRWFRWE